MPARTRAAALISGTPVAVRAAIDLAGLAPDDVRAEVVIGRVDSNGHLEETEVIVLPFVEQQGPAAVFAKDIMPERTGQAGLCAARQPESLRRSPYPACAQPDEMEFTSGNRSDSLKWPCNP